VLSISCLRLPPSYTSEPTTHFHQDSLDVLPLKAPKHLQAQRKCNCFLFTPTAWLLQRTWLPESICPLGVISPMKFCSTSSSTSRRATSSQTFNAYRNASAGLLANLSSGDTTAESISNTGTRSIESDRSSWGMREMWIGRLSTCTGRGLNPKPRLYWTASSRVRLTAYKSSK
jgi:hypothetical protein